MECLPAADSVLLLFLTVLVAFQVSFGATGVYLAIGTGPHVCGR